MMVKVFERIVYDQVYAYLEEHSIIFKYQSGFRAIHSIVAAFLEATDPWHKSMPLFSFWPQDRFIAIKQLRHIW